MFMIRFLYEGPNTDLSWLLFVVLGSFVLVILVGALASRVKIPPHSGGREPESLPSAKADEPSPTKRTPVRNKKRA